MLFSNKSISFIHMYAPERMSISENNIALLMQCGIVVRSIIVPEKITERSRLDLSFSPDHNSIN